MSLITRLTLTILLPLFIPLISLHTQTRVVQTSGETHYIDMEYVRFKRDIANIFRINLDKRIVSVRQSSREGLFEDVYKLESANKHTYVMSLNGNKFVLVITNKDVGVSWETNGKDYMNVYELLGDKEIENISEEEAQRIAKQQAQEAKRKAELSAIVHNLEEYDSKMYQDIIDEQRDAILAYFHQENKQYDNSIFPDFYRLRKSKNKHARYISTYDMHYKLHPLGKPVNEVGFEVVTSTREFTTMVKTKHLSGDSKYPVLEKSTIRIPYVETSGVKARSEVYIDNLHIDFARGITEVKVKNGKVKYKKNEPDTDLQNKLIGKLQNEKNGKYNVEYEVANIMGKETINTETTKIKKKGGVWSTVGIVAALGGAYILDLIRF